MAGDLARSPLMPIDVLPRLAESDRVAGAAEEIRQAVLRMEPGDKLIIERHPVEPGKSLFTLTERTHG